MPHDMNYAPRLHRLIAQFLDGVVAAAPVLLSLLFVAISEQLFWVLLIASAAWSGFYYFFADGLAGGQSYGKRWMGIRVVDDRSGKPCSFGQSFLRNLLLAILGPIDWVFIFGERHQRLGDKAAHTFVLTKS